MVRAIAAVTEAPAHTTATLTHRQSTPSSGTAAAVIGVSANPTKQAAATVTMIRYQRRGVRLTSTIGPITNAQVVGSNTRLTRPDTAATLTP